MLATSQAVLAQDICVSDTGNYTVVLDLYAGELGALFAAAARKNESTDPQYIDRCH